MTLFQDVSVSAAALHVFQEDCTLNARHEKVTCKIEKKKKRSARLRRVLNSCRLLEIFAILDLLLFYFIH